MSPCKPCESGPADVAGHFALMVQRLGNGVLLFKCQSCQSLWIRKTLAGGAFAWEATGELDSRHTPAGTVVPTLPVRDPA